MRAGTALKLALNVFPREQRSQRGLTRVDGKCILYVIGTCTYQLGKQMPSDLGPEQCAGLLVDRLYRRVGWSSWRFLVKSLMQSRHAEVFGRR